MLVPNLDLFLLKCPATYQVHDEDFQLILGIVIKRDHKRICIHAVDERIPVKLLSHTIPQDMDIYIPFEIFGRV